MWLRVSFIHPRPCIPTHSSLDSCLRSVDPPPLGPSSASCRWISPRPSLSCSSVISPHPLIATVSWCGQVSCPEVPSYPAGPPHAAGPFWFVTPFLVPANVLPWVFLVRFGVWHLYKILQGHLLTSEWDFSFTPLLCSLLFFLIHWINMCLAWVMPFGLSPFVSLSLMAGVVGGSAPVVCILSRDQASTHLSSLFLWSFLQRPETTQYNGSVIFPQRQITDYKRVKEKKINF